MNKKIVFGSLLAVFLMMMIPNVSAVEYNLNQNTIQMEEHPYKMFTLLDSLNIPSWLLNLLEYIFVILLGWFFGWSLSKIHFSRVVYVDDDAPDEWYDYMHVHTIQEGYEHASTPRGNANTVRIYDGVYKENIVIDGTGIWLFGNGTGRTVIDGCGNEDVIKFDNSGWNRVRGCTITNGTTGINLTNSQWNFIWNNRIENNTYGIKNPGGMYSPIWCNNFVENQINAYDTGENDWSYDGWGEIPMTGNYWDDYTGIDQNDDGIGDTPYQITGGNSIDSYPSMEPWEE